MAMFESKKYKIYLALVFILLSLHGVFLLLNWFYIVSPMNSPFYSQGGPDSGAPFVLGPARFQFMGFLLPALAMPLLVIVASTHRVLESGSTFAKSTHAIAIGIAVLSVACVLLFMLRFGSLRILYEVFTFAFVIVFVLFNLSLALCLLLYPRRTDDRMFGAANLLALLFSLYTPLIGIYLFID